jgi:hypothetical protein
MTLIFIIKEWSNKELHPPKYTKERGQTKPSQVVNLKFRQSNLVPSKTIT